MIYDPYYDKDELHKAIKKFKTQKGCEQLDSRLFMLQAKILSARVDKNVRKIFDKAGTFRPRRNEPIDKDGDCYWRTMRDGRKICFKKGENVREKLMEWWQSRDWKKEGRLARVKKGQHKKSEESLKQKAQENEKIEHKLCDGHNQLLSGLIYRKLDRDRLKNWDGKNVVRAPLDSVAYENPLEFYWKLTKSYAVKMQTVRQNLLAAIRGLYFDDKISDSEFGRMQDTQITSKDIEKYPELKKPSNQFDNLINSFLDHFGKILDASPTLYRGTNLSEVNDMLKNSKIGGTREGAAYFSVDKSIAKSYAHGDEGVLLKFNPKGIDLKKHLGIFHKGAAWDILEYIAMNYGVPLQRQNIGISPDNLTIYITSEVAESNKARLKEYSKIVRVEIVDAIF